ncbi:hypothetical protein B0H19DRAFT_1184262, partial [Mycena capillaripes]
MQSPNQTASTSGPLNNSAPRPAVISFAAFNQGTDGEDDHDELDTYFDTPRLSFDAGPSSVVVREEGQISLPLSASLS